MSEPIWMSITIGGTITKKLYKELIGILKDEIREDVFHQTIDEIEDFPVEVSNTFSGQSHYGECDDIKAFCEKHNLSYFHKCGGTEEYDTTISYWTPGMKEAKSDITLQSGDQVVTVKTIQPYLNMLTQIIKEGLPCLPLLLNDPIVGDTVTKMLKSKTPYIVLEKEIKALIPDPIPSIPELIITCPNTPRKS